MIDCGLREVVGIETRQPGLQEWSPRRGGRGDDLRVVVGIILHISMIIFRPTPDGRSRQVRVRWHTPIAFATSTLELPVLPTPTGS
eukprot:6213208-Pleurochrysis_carterae.AAC.1